MSLLCKKKKYKKIFSREIYLYALSIIKPTAMLVKLQGKVYFELLMIATSTTMPVQPTKFALIMR